MTCENCRELLTDYQHAELDARSDAAVFEHLGSCPQCREELAAQASLTESLRSAFAEELELPPAVVAGVRQAVRTERSVSVLNAWRAVLRPVVLAPTAAAVILAVGVATFVHNNANAAPQVSAEYLVRQHVAHTLNTHSGDRAWNAYLLTSNS